MMDSRKPIPLRGLLGGGLLIALASAGACQPAPPTCLPPSVMYMGRCLPPCIENGIDYCAGPDGSVVLPPEGGVDAAMDARDSQTTDGPDGISDTGDRCPIEGQLRCAAGCVDSATSVENCGRCGNFCPAPTNGVASCNGGVCGLAMCVPGFGDCDMNAGNGCETDLAMSATHCGRCGNVCSSANASPACGRSITGTIACTIGACNMGFANCDNDNMNGCEVAIDSDAANCGRCGNACPNAANGAGACIVGACAVQCNAGYHLLNGVCVMDGVRPRLLSPLSLGDVTRRQPALRWESPAAFDGAVVELCRDRACMQVIETIRTRMNSARPTMALPANSVVFWRVRGTSGMAEDRMNSATWLFHTPVRDASAGVDSSFNAHLDVNGDGYDDLAVGAERASPSGRVAAGEVRVFQGAVLGVPAVATTVVEGLVAGAGFGFQVANVGDLNGDGFGDLIVTARNQSPPTLLFGSGTGIVPMARQLLAEPQLPGAISAASDVNGDGFADFVVQTPGTNSIHVFHGSQIGVNLPAARTISGGAPYPRFGETLSSGDANGDGLGDIFVGAPGAAPGGRQQAGSALVYYGGAAGISVVGRILEGVAPFDEFGRALSTAHDVDGDGFTDLIVAAPSAAPGGRMNAGSVSLFSGSALGIGANPSRTLFGVSAGDSFGETVGALGDVDADGFGDVAVSSVNALPIPRCSVFLGSMSGLQANPVRVFVGAAATDAFGSSVAGVGDLNGDGFRELAIGAPFADPSMRLDAGSVYYFYGAIAGLPAVASGVLAGSVANDRFGTSIGR